MGCDLGAGRPDTSNQRNPVVLPTAIDSATIEVDDHDRALAFYPEVLHLEGAPPIFTFADSEDNTVIGVRHRQRLDEDMAKGKPTIVTAAEWERALASLTEQEEAVAAELDRLTAARKRMPMVRIGGDYRFEGPHGEVSLVDLFEGRSQLILYRFFFEEGVDGWPDAGCVGCSSWADGVADLGLLHARDITFAMASPAPQPSLRAYAERMGWTGLPWYTIRSDSFTQDFGTTEWFALNVFLRDGDEVYRTHFLQNGTLVSHIGSVASLLALTPYGGQIEGEEVPDGWPQESFSYWMRRHDEFDEPAPSARP